MTRLCLNTSAYSHFKRGDSRVVDEHFRQIDRVGACVL